MRLARFGPMGCERPAVAGPDRIWRDLTPLTDDITGGFLALGLPTLQRDMVALPPLPEEVTRGRIGPPLTSIGKIVCIGLNYRDHAAETGATLPAEPIVFLKTPDTVVGPCDDVAIPVGSHKTDWEVELAVVIGAQARYLDDVDAARACIAGYAISNDVSEREFQLERGGQWDKGKNCETFNPLGPWLVTADEVPDPQALGMRLSVDGTPRQDGNSKDMVFGVDHLVWYLSQFMVLRPGDVINSGTPAGVALGLPGTPYLCPGDVVEVEIDGLGRQRQTFVQALR